MVDKILVFIIYHIVWTKNSTKNKITGRLEQIHLLTVPQPKLKRIKRK